MEAQQASLERYACSLVAPLLAGAAQQQGPQDQKEQAQPVLEPELEAEVESMWQQEQGAGKQRTPEQQAVQAEVERVGRRLRWLRHSQTPLSAQHAACLAHLEQAGSLEDDMPQAWQELAVAWPADVQAAWQQQCAGQASRRAGAQAGGAGKGAGGA